MDKEEGLIPILKRYIGREYLKILSITLLFIIALFHIIDLMDHLDNFKLYGAGSDIILKFYLLKTPEFFVSFLPFALLISAVILLVIRSRFNETIAVFTSGLSLINLIEPIVIIAGIFAFFSFLTSEIVVPRTSLAARDIEANYIKKKERAARFFQNRYWLRVKDGVIVAHVLDEEKRTVLGFTYIVLDEQGRLTKRFDAREASYNVAWNLKNVDILDLEGIPVVRKEPNITLDLPATFDTFFSSQKSPSDMNSGELRKYISEIQHKGYDARSYLVDFHSRFSYLTLNIIIIFLAAPFSIVTPRKGTLITSVLLAVIIGFACWVLFSIFTATGRKGILNPLIASWSPDIILAMVAFYVYKKFRF